MTELLHTMYEEEIASLGSKLDTLAGIIHALNEKWWILKWDDEQNCEVPDRNKGEALMLIVSEIAEAMEGVRKGKQDEHCPDFSNEEVELADAIIRILDYGAGFHLRIGDALIAKLRYNAYRPDHRPENRMKAGGKKF